MKITEWTEKFKILYKVPDRDRKPEEFWNAVMAHLSGIGESIRRTHNRELLDHAASAFTWILCYVGKCNEIFNDDPTFFMRNNLTEIIGLKYPEMCGHCEGNPCICDPIKMDQQADKAARYGKLLIKWHRIIEGNDFTIDNWLDALWDIYKAQIHIQTMENIGFHLLEEAGEEARAVRHLVRFRKAADEKVKGIDNDLFERIGNIPGLVEEYTKTINFLKAHYKKTSQKELKIDVTDRDPEIIKSRLVIAKMDFVTELADTFSWFCAVLLKLRKMIDTYDFENNVKEKYELEEVLKGKFNCKNKEQAAFCYECNKDKCECKFV